MSHMLTPVNLRNRVNLIPGQVLIGKNRFGRAIGRAIPGRIFDLFADLRCWPASFARMRVDLMVRMIVLFGVCVIAV